MNNVVDLNLQSAFKKIKADAEHKYPSDIFEQQSYITSELEFFKEFQGTDFAALRFCSQAELKDWVFLHANNWAEASIVLKVLQAVYEFAERVDGYMVSESRTLKFISSALEQKVGSEPYTDTFYTLLDELKTRELDEKLEGKLDVIKNIERIIASHCHHDKDTNVLNSTRLIKNHDSFRYPISFYDDAGDEFKKKVFPNGLDNETFVSGFYKFGANKLEIVKAIYEVITYLEEEHGLNLNTE